MGQLQGLSIVFEIFYFIFFSKQVYSGDDYIPSFMGMMDDVYQKVQVLI